MSTLSIDIAILVDRGDPADHPPEEMKNATTLHWSKKNPERMDLEVEASTLVAGTGLLLARWQFFFVLRSS